LPRLRLGAGGWRREFQPSSEQRRNLRRNGDIVVTECRPWATAEQFELLSATSASAIPAAAWRQWTRSTTPTWWNTPLFRALCLNTGNLRRMEDRAGWSAPA
jgi:hypothetical protein